RRKVRCSSQRPLQKRHELIGLGALLFGVAGSKGRTDAVIDVLAQEFMFHLGDRGALRGELGEDVDAVAVLLYHPPDAAHLTFDAAKAVLEIGFVRAVHGGSPDPQDYTPWG